MANFSASRSVSQLALALIGLGFLLQPAMTQAQSSDQLSPKTNNIVIELFYRADSDQSMSSKKFLEELQKSRSGIELKSYDMLTDKLQLKRLLELTKQYGHEKPGLPAIYLCNTLQLGFRDAQTSAPKSKTS